MSWNHRLLAHEHNGEVYFKIHEVYYSKNGKPNVYTSNAVTVGGEDLDEVGCTLSKMQECLNKPVLWAGKKFPEEYSK